MLKHLRLTPEFVQYIPQQLKPGILYISPEFGTVTHSCCCGCGTEVNTPLNPKGWNITYDGETVTLAPSVGNWNIPCRSHYIIDQNQVIECGSWTPTQARQEQIRTQKALKQHFNPQQETVTPSTNQEPHQLTNLDRIINYLSHLWK